MKNGDITWGQIKNIAFVGGGIVAAIIAFMTLSAKVGLLDQKMDIMLANQTEVVNKMSNRIDGYEDEIKEYDLAIKELQILVGIEK